MTMKQDAAYWFQWERQATVHPILLCMEAWMKPIEKAYGKPWPTAVIIYKNDIVGWYDPWPELLEYGQYCIDRFLAPSAQQELEAEVRRQAKGLEDMFQRFDSTDLSKTHDAELKTIYDEIHQRWIDWFVPGGLVEPIGHQGEKLLLQLLDGQPDAPKSLSLITTTSRDSFSKRELQDLLAIALARKNGQDVRPLLGQHAQKYYWMHNGYFTTEVLGPDFFAKELALAESKYPDPEAQLRLLQEEPALVKKEKGALLERLNLSARDRQLIQLLDLFAWYQDYRKEYTMRMLHYLDAVLAETGRRKGFTLKQMRYTLSAEIPKIMDGTIDRALVLERMKHCLFHWDAKNGTFIHGTGDFAAEKEKEIFHSIRHDADIVEVSGMVASRGSVRGRAHVTMSAKEAQLVAPGEILITSMTTPDFVTAIKKAAAVVTNEGGILCHAAVISREFGLPCIVGTRIATKVFRTGDMIEVDGELGVVRKVQG